MLKVYEQVYPVTTLLTSDVPESSSVLVIYIIRMRAHPLMQEKLLSYFQVASQMVPSHLPPSKFTDLTRIQRPQKRMVYWTKLKDVMLRHCNRTDNAVANVKRITHGIFFLLIIKSKHRK